MADNDISAQAPYGNKYNDAKQYSSILFTPGRPALASEINELQSMQTHQTELLGDSLFQEGSVISGMTMIPKKDSSGDDEQAQNSFYLDTLHVSKASLNTDTYNNQGVIKVTSANEVDTDYPSIDFSGVASTGAYMTLSFSLKKSSGTINKVALDYNKDLLSPIKYTIDGTNVAPAKDGSIITDDMSSNPIVNESGTQFNLNDTKEHKFVYVFRTKDSGQADFTLSFNPSSRGLSTAFVEEWRNLMIEDGQTATDWVLNPVDDTSASAINRVKNYTVTDGRIWLEGQVREFHEQDISIKGIGTETIGVQLVKNIVTSEDDPDLLDTTEGVATSGMRGADRVHYDVELTYNDDSATDFVVFTDNKINQNAIQPDYDKLTPILAKRTYDQSGSFRTSGFNVTPGDYATDDTKINLAIDAGQAYVRGFSISTSETYNLQTDKAVETGTATNEGYTYNKANGNHPLSNQPVKDVKTVTANIRDTNNNVIRNASGVVDSFTEEPAYRVVSVTQNGKRFTEGTDFVLIGGTQISWGQDGSGNKLVNATVPKASTSYTVVYEYTHVLEKDKDYSVDVNDNDTTSINIAGGNGLKPIDGSVVTVTYDYFLARIDMIMITQYQQSPFKIIKGDPMPITTAKPPVVHDPMSLELGYVLIYPNSDRAIFTMQTITRTTFDTMQHWDNRISNLEYNIAVDELNNSVKKNEDPVTVKDAFSDSFADANKADLDHKDFNVDYDPENGEITIPIKSESYIEPSKDEMQASSAFSTMGELVTAPYTEELAMSQTKATGVINVNEWNIFNVNGTMELNPSADSWIDTKSTTVMHNKKGKHLRIYRWWRHANQNNFRDYIESGDTLDYFSQLQGINWNNTHMNQKTSGYIISNGGQKTVDTAIEYMRSRKVKFTAKNFKPFTDGFVATIEGTDLDAPTPASKEYKGSKEGTFKSDAKGVIKGTVTIPGGVIKCGKRAIKLTSPDGSQASATYTAQGTMRDVQTIINKTTYAVTLYDPLAQSFTLDRDYQLTSIDLFFNQKAPANGAGHNPGVIVQIRELSDDGYPNRTIKAEQTLLPDDVKTSDDASVATKVVFDQSVALTANQGYAIVLISDSDNYTLYKASRGERLIGSDNTLLSAAPNPNGTVFTSQNAQTWVADPGTSLKFNIRVAHFNQNGVVEFNPVDLTQKTFDDDNNTPVSNADRFVLMATYLTPQNTGMHWYFRLVPNSSSANITSQKYQPITAITGGNTPVSPGADDDDITEIKRLIESSRWLQLKAEFSSSRYVSPILSMEDLTIPLFLSDNEGTYLSVNMDESGSAAFNRVKLQYDAYIPTGTSVTPYYSVDGGTKWYTLADNGSSRATPVSNEQISAYFNRYIYQCKVPGTVDQNHLAEQFKVKLVLHANSNFSLPRVRKLTCMMKNE